MIRIQRGKEIPELAAIRNTELAKLRQIVKTRAPNSKDFSGYGIVKETLRKRQYFKCCFCELKQEVRNRDAEHFRPKTEADVSPHPSGTVTGYW